MKNSSHYLNTRFMSSGILRWIAALLIPDASKKRNAFMKRSTSAKTAWPLKISAVSSFETSGIYNPDTHRNDPDDLNIQHHAVKTSNLALSWLFLASECHGVRGNKLQIQFHVTSIPVSSLKNNLREFQNIKLEVTTGTLREHKWKKNVISYRGLKLHTSIMPNLLVSKQTYMTRRWQETKQSFAHTWGITECISSFWSAKWHSKKP
jgi:hypothetical protein